MVTYETSPNSETGITEEALRPAQDGLSDINVDERWCWDCPPTVKRE